MQCPHCGEENCEQCPAMLATARENGFEGNVMHAISTAREGELSPAEARTSGQRELERLVGVDNAEAQ